MWSPWPYGRPCCAPSCTACASHGHAALLWPCLPFMPSSVPFLLVPAPLSSASPTLAQNLLCKWHTLGDSPPCQLLLCSCCLSPSLPASISSLLKLYIPWFVLIGKFSCQSKQAWGHYCFSCYMLIFRNGQREKVENVCKTLQKTSENNV